jgi:prolyl-tRNA editing enzyme YbaK/EbsC (Cys-tRNA(Pro) deacylase)
MHPRSREFRQRAAEEFDFEVDVHEFPEGTKTAADAADAVGCDLAQIASAIAMRAGDRLLVVVTSGANRVDERDLAALEGVDEADVGMADADAIKDALGWSIGGVPPFCHDTSVPVYIDETLTGFDTVWAAAGTPQALFPVDPATIRTYADAEAVAVATPK